MRNSLRTFVAVDLPPEVKTRARQLIDQLRPTEANVRWVSAEQMHWTLKFLGEIDLTDAPAICTAVSEAVAGFEPFDVEAVGAGAFPDPHNARTVWLGAGDGSDQLVELHAAIEGRLAGLGFRAEQRRFRPHITLGRVRRSLEGLRELGDLIRQNAQFDAGLSTVFEVGIYSSELGPQGPSYQALGHASLGG